MEIEAEVKTVEVDMMCDECKTGKMRPTGNSTTNWGSVTSRLWPHRCDGCLRVASYTVTYPHISYRKITP